MSCNLGPFSCILSLFFKDKEVKYLEIGQVKENEDLDTRSQQSALELLKKECVSTKVSDLHRVKSISQRYVEVFRFEPNSLGDADTCINDLVSKSDDFLKLFSTSVAKEIREQPMKPSERVDLNTHICARIR